MSVASASRTALPKPTRVEDPDDYRMTLGEHLEELRSRLIWGLLGFAIAFGIALAFVKDMLLPFMCKPLIDSLDQNHLNTMLYTSGLGDAFSMYLYVSSISAVIVAGPWLIWQMWLFIAAGLYPHERKVVTRFIPLSVGLFIGGVTFAFYVVMPMTLTFFIWFSGSINLPSSYAPQPAAQSSPAMIVPSMKGDPAQPVEFQIWFNTTQNRMKFYSPDHEVRTITFMSEKLIGPLPSLNDYMDLLLTTLLLFGLSFQMPLVVLAIVRAGIVELAALKKARRVVYFVIAVAAAFITPGDVISTTIMLMFPLIGLYEFGLILAREKKTVPA